MALYNLLRIRESVRQLTGSLTNNRLTDQVIDDWVNTYMLHDMASEMRLFPLRANLEFYTTPNVDTYEANTTVGSPLYNFNNRYTNVYGPCFVGGRQAYFTQDQTSFNTQWIPYVQPKDTLLRGNGTPGPYISNVTAFTATPVLPRSVVFSALDANGNSIILKDYPVSPSVGALGVPDIAQVLPSPHGQINYMTGAYTLQFNVAVPLGNQISCTAISYVTSVPYAILYYANKFTLRPVPDKVYKVQLQGDLRPTELLQDTSVPFEDNWWQLVAYGAAIKILEHRKDFDGANQLKPTFEEQKTLVFRATQIQITQQRAATFWVQDNKYPAYPWPWFIPY